MDNLKRVIVDFKKLTPEVLKLLVDKYPDGYDDKILYHLGTPMENVLKQ